MSSISLEEPGAYQSLQMVLQNEFGIVIGEERENTITAKLKPVISEFSLDSLQALVSEMQNKGSSKIKNGVLQAITSHEDAWFEPDELFNLLDDYLLPDMLKPGRDSYRIWVIGCNTGQLPYSLAMKIHQAGKQANAATSVTIEATDISEVAVNRAARGVFEEASMEGMVDPLKKKYMDQQSGQWRVIDDIKSMINFSTCNLLEDFEDKGHFDLIICLDVLLYFSVPVKAQLLESFSTLLDPSGILIAGMTEPVLPLNSNFDMVRHEDGIFYRQKTD
jgi:chemotaxis protein methyltransferase CheR